MTHMTKDKGDLAVAMTLADLRKHGIICCLPISEHLPFDVVAIMPDTTTLVRLQVKYRKANGYGGIDLMFRSNYYNSKKIYSKPIDLSAIDGFAIYNPDTDAVYYLSAESMQNRGKSITLRIRPSANNQKQGVWLADDFRNPFDIVAMMGNKVDDFPMQPPMPQIDFAVDMVILDLMKHGIQILLPRATYLPFSIIGVCEDMKTLVRYKIGMDAVDVNPYVDKYAIYSSETGDIAYISANSLSSDITKLAFSKSRG
ncbi:MAG: group I intron-associated PD-(D/E)XK endonuclease [Phototrophicales bacterium]|nr:group I intron-associated PD-(D/E)XK endonuclease [Phototrophicales bacterium]